MSKLEVGMYVRTKKYGIAKIIGGISDKFNIDVFKKDGCTLRCQKEKDILKASFNIIDVIKPKDIILGRDGKLYQCWKIYKDYVFTYSKNKYGVIITLVDYQIDRILTKEQFESMSYRIGE